jgi:hypothetical protein
MPPEGLGHAGGMVHLLMTMRSMVEGPFGDRESTPPPGSARSPSPGKPGEDF